MRKKEIPPKWPRRFYYYLIAGIIALALPIAGNQIAIGPEAPLFTSYYGSLITLVAFPITINEIIQLRNYQVEIAKALRNNYRKIDTRILLKRIEDLQRVLSELTNEMQRTRPNAKKVINLAAITNAEYRKIVTGIRENEYIKNVTREEDDLTQELNELFIFANKEIQNGINDAGERRKNVKHLLDVEVNLEHLSTQLKNTYRNIHG